MKDITQIDRFLVAFHGVISNAMLARDVGRTERWVKARVTRLKNCGAWDALVGLQKSEEKWFAQYFDALGKEHFIDSE